MTPDVKFPIEQYFLTENRCYKANKHIAPICVQVHSVGCKGTDRDRWRKWNNPNIEKCPNAFIDTKGIMQTLPWDSRPWLSGSGNVGNANNFAIGFEMCEPSEANDTPEAAAYLYNCAKYLCTQFCIDYGILPDNVLCHSELHRLGVASNHADVKHWWGKKGTSWEPYTMDRLRAEIAQELASRGLPTKPEQLPANRLPTLRKGYVGAETKYLQQLLGIGTDGMYGPGTEGAVKAFQKKKGLSADGICGAKTWAALITGTDEQPEPIPVPVPDPEPEPEPDDDTELVEMTLAEALEIRAILRKALEKIELSIESR